MVGTERRSDKYFLTSAGVFKVRLIFEMGLRNEKYPKSNQFYISDHEVGIIINGVNKKA